MSSKTKAQPLIEETTLHIKTQKLSGWRNANGFPQSVFGKDERKAAQQMEV